MEAVGSVLSMLAGIVLVVLGARARDANGKGTRSGKQMVVLGLVVLLSSIMVGASDFMQGLRDGAGD